MQIKEFFNIPAPGVQERPTSFSMNGSFFTARNSVKLESDESRICLGGEWISCDALPYEFEKSISGAGSLMRGPDGGRVLYCSADVPTFDEFDRKYDSIRCVYFERIDGDLTALYFSSGYELGSVYLYLGVEADNEAAAQALAAAEL